MSDLSPADKPPHVSAGENIGSLAQSARKKQLKTAKGLLLFIGILTVVLNVGLIALGSNMIDSQLQQEIQAVRAEGLEVDQGEVNRLRQQAMTTLMIVNGVGAAIGVVFIILALNIYRAPVPITITALVLYVGAGAIYGMIDPSTLLRGWIIKIIIIVCLFRAVTAAIAYENERKAAGPSPV